MEMSRVWAFVTATPVAPFFSNGSEMMHVTVAGSVSGAGTAAGAGVSVQEVNRLLKQFEQSRDMMKKMQKGGLAKMMRALGGMGLGKFGGGMPPMGGFGGFGR